MTRNIQYKPCDDFVSILHEKDVLLFRNPTYWSYACYVIKEMVWALAVYIELQIHLGSLLFDKS